MEGVGTIAEKKELPEYTVILDNRQEGIYEGAAFDSYEEFSQTFDQWCAERHVRFTKLHSQTIEAANRWMAPGLEQYDVRLKYKSVLLTCVYADRKPKKGEPVETLTFRKRGATGCQACVHIKVTRENMRQLVIRNLCAEHNHPPVPIEDYALSLDLEESSYPSMVHREDPRRSLPILEAVSNFSNGELPDEANQDTETLNDPASSAMVRFLGPQRVVRKRRAPASRTSNASTPKAIRSSLDTTSLDATPFVAPEYSSESSIKLLQLLEAQPNLDEEDLFCRSLAIKLRMMNAETGSKLKIQIQTLVHNALFSNTPISMHPDKKT